MYWFLKRILIGPLVWLAFRPKVVGRARLPKETVGLLAANHQRKADSLLVALIAPRQVYFGVSADMFRRKGIFGRLFRRGMLKLGQMPVDRDGGRPALEFVNQAIAKVRDGRLVGIFPEGGLSPDGRLYDARTGAARIALGAGGSPIIPIALVYPARWWGRVQVIIGEPLWTLAITDGYADREAVAHLSEAITDALAGLSGRPRAHARLNVRRSS